jgi:hypothetical protein
MHRHHRHHHHHHRTNHEKARRQTHEWARSVSERKKLCSAALSLSSAAVLGLLGVPFSGSNSFA